MRIALSPGQAVSIHGWLRARQTLTWGDVLTQEGLTFSKLLSFNLGEQDLYVLQPDLQAWTRQGKATLADCPRMRAWDAHPIRDFKADLADLVGMHWPHEALTRMGVTYEDLLQLGLTAESMNLFGFTLMMWASLGFRRPHAEATPPNTLYRLFGMAKHEVLASLR
jgi:hypothetical protein